MLFIAQGDAPTVLLFAGVSSPAGSAYGTIDGTGTPAAGAGSVGTTSITLGGITYYFYVVALAAGETAVLGDLAVVANDGLGGSPAQANYQIVPWKPENAVNLGLSNLDATISSRGTSNYAGGAVASVTGNVGGDVVGNLQGHVFGSVFGSVSNVTGNILGNLNGNVFGGVLGTVASVIAPTDVSGSSLAAIVAALLDAASSLDAGQTLRESLRLILAALAGKVAISGSTVTIRNTDDTKDRITATTDPAGQRTAITYDVT